MNYHIAIGLFMASIATMTATQEVSAQGRLSLLPQGKYICALPGNAAGAVWNEQPDRNFTITSASSYRASHGSGTYLLEGNRVTFTRGPMKSRRMMLLPSGLLQEMDQSDEMKPLRCHRAGPASN